MGFGPGILGLVGLLREQWGPIEADFQHFYGLNLAECLWGSEALSVRRLRALIVNLPADAMTRLVRAEAEQPSNGARPPGAESLSLREFGMAVGVIPEE